MGKYLRDVWNSATILAGASTTLFSERWIGAPGRIFALGAEVSNMSLWPDTTFSLKINGVPVPGYGKIQDRIGSIDLLTSVDIPVPAFALVEVTAENGSGFDSVFIARLKIEMENDEVLRT